MAGHRRGRSGVASSPVVDHNSGVYPKTWTSSSGIGFAIDSYGGDVYATAEDGNAYYLPRDKWAVFIGHTRSGYFSQQIPISPIGVELLHARNEQFARSAPPTPIPEVRHRSGASSPPDPPPKPLAPMFEELGFGGQAVFRLDSREWIASADYAEALCGSATIRRTEKGFVYTGPAKVGTFLDYDDPIVQVMNRLAAKYGSTPVRSPRSFLRWWTEVYSRAFLQSPAKKKAPPRTVKTA
jgi:hypothetical protein